MGALRDLPQGCRVLRTPLLFLGAAFGLTALLFAQAQDAAQLPSPAVAEETNTSAPMASTPALPDPTPPPLVAPSLPPPTPAPAVAPGPALPLPPPPATATSSVGPSVTFGPQTPNYGLQGNRKAAQLRTQPPERFTFDRALLRDVLYFLADAAGIPFVSIAESAPQAMQLVTFRMTASPFATLESVLQQNGLKLVFENGVWVVKQAVNFDGYRDEREAAIRQKQDENELVGVMYQLRFDSADKIEFRNSQTGGELRSGTAGQ